MHHGLVVDGTLVRVNRVDYAFPSLCVSCGAKHGLVSRELTFSWTPHDAGSKAMLVHVLIGLAAARVDDETVWLRGVSPRVRALIELRFGRPSETCTLQPYRSSPRG